MNSPFKVSFRFRVAEIVLAALILTSGLFLGFSSGSFVVSFSKIGFTVVSTLSKGVSQVTGAVTGVVTYVHDMASLQKEYALLTEKLKDYEYMQRSNTEIRKENERLKEQLGFASELQYKNIAAQIIARDPDNLYSGVTIGKGARHGIRKDMSVIAIQNGNVGIVGKVINVAPETSLVMPLYDSKCHISARIQNTRDVGIASGNGSYNSPLSLSYIRRRNLEDFNRGDVVVTSGENGNYLKDIPIGRISSIEVLDYDTALDIELEPIIDFLRLDTVIVVDRTQNNDKKPFSLEAK